MDSNGSVDRRASISDGDAERLEAYQPKSGGVFRRRSSQAKSVHSSGRSSTDSTGKLSNFWTSLAKKEDAWEDYDSEDEWDFEENDTYAQICKHIVCNSWERVGIYMKYLGKTLKAHKYIPITTLICLIILLSVCISTTLAFANQYSEDLSNAALDVAAEQGAWFSEQLNIALLPLFSMAQFVKELSYFSDLPFQIGPGGEEGSAPYRDKFIERDGNLVHTHRNVSGICDDPKVLENFNRIARNIKNDAGMEKVLVNVQLAPQAVVCLFYPLNNTGKYFNMLVVCCLWFVVCSGF